MVPYSAYSAVPSQLLEKRKAPAVRLVVQALSSANPSSDLASSSGANLEAGILSFIRNFQVAMGVDSWVGANESIDTKAKGFISLTSFRPNITCSTSWLD